MSRIRANQITNQSADGAPTVQNGLVISGVTTSTNVSVASSVTATTYYGSGANLTNITSTTINNNADNRVITGSGTANTLNGESTLTFDGDDLLLKSSTDGRRISFATDGTSHYMKYDNTLSGIILNGYGGIAFETNGTNERLRIDSSGRVLIGTTNLGNTEADDLTIANSANAGITIRSGTGSQGAIYFSDATSGSAQYDGFLGYSQGNRSMFFGTAQATRMTIDSSGRLMLGTSTPGASQVDTFTLETSGHTGMTFFSGTSNRGTIAFGDGRSGNAQYRGVIMYEHSDDSMRFATADTTQMNISSSGHITTPNQPMCSYDLSSSIQSGNYIIHNTVHTNNGNHYNTGNGRFVCPVAGYYYASLMAMTNNSSTQLDIELHKNGSNPNNILVPYNQSGGIYNQVAGSCIIYCAANDYLQFKLNSGSVYNGRHGNVSFALLA